MLLVMMALNAAVNLLERRALRWRATGDDNHQGRLRRNADARHCGTAAPLRDSLTCRKQVRLHEPYET
jgi:hypothetical protein